MGVRKVGVIRHCDLRLLVGIEGHDREFVVACLAFPVVERRERPAMPQQFARDHAWRRRAVSCAANARISPAANSISCRSTPRVRRPNPLTRVSATLSPECQQPCHSCSEPPAPTGWSPRKTCL
jgi:hypothetical protein